MRIAYLSYFESVLGKIPECERIAISLERQGHEVVRFSTEDISDPKGDFDLALVGANHIGRNNLKNFVDKFKNCPKVFNHYEILGKIDSHKARDRQAMWRSYMNLFDMTISFDTEDQKFSQRWRYLPVGYEPYDYDEAEIEYEVGIVARHINYERFQVINELSNDFKVHLMRTDSSQDLIKEIRKCACVVDIPSWGNVPKAFNDRVFIVPGHGVPLITLDVDGIDYVGNSGEHFLLYKNNNEIKDVVYGLLENEQLRDILEYQAPKFFEKKHTFDQRAKDLISYVEEII